LVDGMAVGAFAVAIPLPRFTAELEARVVQKLEQTVGLFAAAETPA